MKEYKIYAGGRFISSGKELIVTNPFNSEQIARTYLADETILEKAIIAAQQVRRQLSALSSFQRYSILTAISAEITSRKDEFAKVLSLESAKPIRYAAAEIERAAQTFLVAAEEAKRLPKEYLSLDWTAGTSNKEGIVRYFPVGLVAGIAPFNFPLNLAVHKIAPAIASGCPIILKPATATPLSTLLLAEIIDRTDLPKGAVSILPMDRSTGNKLVTDDRFALLSFTGSAPVGWKMKSDAGKKKVVLELGGNAAVIVAESADVAEAVKKSLVAAFAYSGQVCIHAQRFYVHAKHFEQFSDQMVKHTKKLISGDPLNPATEVSMMIDEENAKRVEQWIGEAVSSGARLITGGQRKGNFIEPTILTSTTSAMKVCSEEIFGPVIVIEKFDDFGEAIAMVNDSAFGLQAGVFTDSLKEQQHAFRWLDVGGVIINDVPTFRADHMPYGGIKDSGLGREGIRYAIMDMMEPKILVQNT